MKSNLNTCLFDQIIWSKFLPFTHTHPHNNTHNAHTTHKYTNILTCTATPYQLDITTEFESKEMDMIEKRRQIREARRGENTDKKNHTPWSRLQSHTVTSLASSCGWAHYIVQARYTGCTQTWQEWTQMLVRRPCGMWVRTIASNYSWPCCRPYFDQGPQLCAGTRRSFKVGVGA